MSEKLKVKNE